MEIENRKQKPLQKYSSEKQQNLLDLEMALQNASLAHEYTRLELENLPPSFQEIELAEKLENYKKVYFSARRHLALYYPERLEELEKQLMDQKKEFFTFYSA
jgi:hypothetical protein